MITFRKVTISDIELLQQLADKIWKISYRNILSEKQISYMLHWMYSTDTIQKEIEEDVIWEFVELNNIPIGFISVSHTKNELKINKIYMDPGEHGKGFGQQAINHIIDYGLQMDCKKVYLTVNKKNTKAIKAYEKAGLVCTDSKVFDIGGGFIMDDYIYSYDL